jgi:hypothetical protein
VGTAERAGVPGSFARAHVIARVAVVACLVGLAGCEDDASAVIVDLKTDLVPVRELVAVRTEVSSTPFAMATGEPRRVETLVTAEQEFLSGVRVAEIEGLAPGTYHVRVSAFGAGERRGALRRWGRQRLRWECGLCRSGLQREGLRGDDDRRVRCVWWLRECVRPERDPVADDHQSHVRRRRVHAGEDDGEPRVLAGRPERDQLRDDLDAVLLGDVRESRDERVELRSVRGEVPRRGYLRVDGIGRVCLPWMREQRGVPHGARCECNVLRRGIATSVLPVPVPGRAVHGARVRGWRVRGGLLLPRLPEPQLLRAVRRAVLSGQSSSPT